MIHFFHGQFDHPTVWNNYQFLDHRTKSYNLYDLKSEEIENIKTGPQDILIGYSLGGRIALKIASQNHYNLKKMILLSSHPGLDPHEKGERRLWEEEILLRMRTNSMDKFFDFWNALPLFSQSTHYRPLSKSLFNKSIILFENNRLSNQPNFIEDILRYKEKILYVFGYKDKKYSDIGWNLALKGIQTLGINSDHRVHLHKKSIIEIIQRELQT